METTTQGDKNLQDELKESARRVWLAGLGALAAAGEEGSKMFSKLVDRGRDYESKGRVTVSEQVNRATSAAETTWDNLGDRFDEMMTATLHRLGVPTREEIRTLTQRVEELNSKVEALKPRVTPAASPEPVVVMPGTPDPTDPTKIVV